MAASNTNIKNEEKELYRIEIAVVDGANRAIDKYVAYMRKGEELIIGRQENFSRNVDDLAVKVRKGGQSEPIYVFKHTIARYGCPSGEPDCTSREHLILRIENNRPVIYDRATFYTAKVKPEEGFNLVEILKKGIPYVLEPNNPLYLRLAGVYSPENKHNKRVCRKRV
ncbi:MAG: hypothetical protein QXQ14_00525 [Candidatus Aenigmatarchaeota archaeon]